MAKISKSKLNKLMDLSNNPNIDLVKDNDKEYEAKVKGKKDKMKKSSFEETVLEFIKEQKEFNKNIKNDVKEIKLRLDILELDVKEIKSLPTIQNELKSQK